LAFGVDQDPILDDVFRLGRVGFETDRIHCEKKFRAFSVKSRKIRHEEIRIKNRKSDKLLERGGYGGWVRNWLGVYLYCPQGVLKAHS
jgi:hypothetical protein